MSRTRRAQPKAGQKASAPASRALTGARGLFASGSRSRGAILAVVLVMLLSLSGYVVGSMDDATSGAMEVGLLYHEYEAGLVAEAALPIIGDMLRADSLGGYDSLQEPWATEYKDAGLTIKIRPANAYLDLSLLSLKKDDEVRKRALTAISTLFLEEQIGSTEVNALGDWIDSDTDSQAVGGEAYYYILKNPRYLPRNGKMFRPEEMLLVHGLEKLSPDYIRDTFTVWSGNANKLNINFAPKDLLSAFVPELSSHIGEIVQWRLSRGFEHISQLLTATGMEGDDEDYLTAINYLTVSSHTFQAMVHVDLPGCQLTRRYVVVRSQYGDDEPQVVCRDDLNVKLTNVL